MEEHRIDFLRLQFADLAGSLRHLDVPARHFQNSLEDELVFDGSSAGGFIRLEESDMLLRPDPGTFAVLPVPQRKSRIARLICDIHRADGAPFEGDPRGVLKRVMGDVADAGFHCTIGMEVEFYLFNTDGGVEHSPEALRRLGGEAVREEIVEALDVMGIAVASAHPEASPGQHEVDLCAVDALRAADHLATLKLVARTIAERNGLRANFMPKPVYGHHGSGLHVHHTLLREGGNAFADPETLDGLSDALRAYVGGILLHARGFAAITNPLVNSYKRLVPGYEAPVQATWSLQGGSPLVRIPAARAHRTGCEVRLGDPAGNPYLSLAVQIASGLDGIRRELDPGAPVNSKVAAMSTRELQRRKIALMPQHLGEALQALEENRVVRNALGEYVFSHFVEAKRAEWEEYVAQVHPWERERYTDV